MTGPTVTAVIPCYNHGEFVREAAASCLAQEKADVRVVIVDDGSDDGKTGAACDACRQLDPERVLVIHQENRGLPAARNRGAREASQRGAPWAGEYLVFLDADDWIEPAFVCRLHAAIQADPETLDRLSHAYCQERLVGLAEMVWAVPEWDDKLMMVTNLHPVTALVRRERFEAVGGFDESMKEGYEDWDLWLKFVERGWQGVRVREPLFVWRRHSHSTMIIEAGQRHRRLYGQLVENHRDLYQRHAPELLVLSNAMLRRADANWLDESGDAIVVRDLRRWTEDLAREREAMMAAHAREREETRNLARKITAELECLVNGSGSGAQAPPAAPDDQQLAALRSMVERIKSAREAERRIATAQQELAERAVDDLRRVCAEYEAKPVVRFSRWMHRTIDRLPRVVSRPIKWSLGGVSRRIKGTAPQARG
jgi:glycosyltransferase involved in cell wall biosynthesis